MPKPVNVTLDWPEMDYACWKGIQRHICHLKKGLEKRDKTGTDDYAWNTGVPPGKLWNLNIEGAAAEYAVAKYTGVPWNGDVGHPKAPDVGPYQVRLSMVGDWGDLILHPPDKDDEVFIHVTGYAPYFKLTGWCRAWEGKIEDPHNKGKKLYWDDPHGAKYPGQPRPAFFVPQRVLHSMETLPSVEEATLR